MSVYKKLMDARVLLQSKKLKKSGFNKFSQYEYFQLSDFLPEINSIFKEIGLCGVVSYGAELACLTITDSEDGSTLNITTPMADCNLKGMHPVQNLGAVQTYIRRYLWVTALEIVENDILDTVAGNTKETTPPLKSVQLSDFDDDEQTFLKDTAMEMMAFAGENIATAYELSVKLDNEEKLAIWGLLDSKTRTALKKYSASINKGE